MPPVMFGRSAKPLSGRSASFAEREELAFLRAQGRGVREVARDLGRSGSNREAHDTARVRVRRRSTVSRELRRNAALQTYVQDRLAGAIVAPGGAAVPGPAVPWKSRRHGPWQNRRWAKAWSPQQIAHRLRLDFPEDATMRISHEAIYQALQVVLMNSRV